MRFLGIFAHKSTYNNIMDKNVIKKFIKNTFGDAGVYMLEQIKDDQISFIETALDINESTNGYYDIMKLAIANVFMSRVLSSDIIKDYNSNKDICNDFIDDYISFFDWIMVKSVYPETFMRYLNVEKPIINDWMFELASRNITND